ncbi:hypothetical protein EVAR_19572_1 [Eumeta japonica]|uniref:Uncharacterized protein n=1 Tax=Eumeta variegata TaxID=151549 RepID=A0A4C1UGI3_EUMVA|nr:hypothetical protein EVAR_19572_1 [Eumeta japonica]
MKCNHTLEKRPPPVPKEDPQPAALPGAKTPRRRRWSATSLACWRLPLSLIVIRSPRRGAAGRGGCPEMLRGEESASWIQRGDPCASPRPSSRPAPILNPD